MDRVPPTCPRPAPPRPRRSIPGFSLVEVLVALTLVGVVLALGLPRLSSLATQARVQRAGQAAQIEVQQAFAIAGRNRVPVRLRWAPAAMQLQVTNLSGGVVYRRMGLGTGSGYGLAAADVTMTPADLTVFPNGLASDSLVITIARGGHSRTIRFSRSGMVRSR